MNLGLGLGSGMDYTFKCVIFSIPLGEVRQCGGRLHVRDISSATNGTSVACFVDLLVASKLLPFDLE